MNIPDHPQNPARRPVMPGDIIELPGNEAAILLAADLEALDLYGTLARRDDTAGVMALYRERRFRFIPNVRQARYLDSKPTPGRRIPCILVELIDGANGGERGWIPNVEPRPAGADHGGQSK